MNRGDCSDYTENNRTRRISDLITTKVVKKEESPFVPECLSLEIHRDETSSNKIGQVSIGFPEAWNQYKIKNIYSRFHLSHPQAGGKNKFLESYRSLKGNTQRRSVFLIHSLRYQIKTQLRCAFPRDIIFPVCVRKPARGDFSD